MSTTVTVLNVEPVIVSFSSDATFDQKAAERELVEFTASFTDVGTLGRRVRGTARSCNAR